MAYKIPLQSLNYFMLCNAVLCGMCALVFRTSLFDAVATQNGFDHYAEAPVAVAAPLLTEERAQLMPLNVLVNAGYLVVGVGWMRKGLELLKKRKIGAPEWTFVFVTSWWTVLYGPVQFLRIVYQRHPFAVLDQWLTLPFFAWTILGLKSLGDGRWSHARNVSFLAASAASYVAALFTSRGFELALGVHVLLAVAASLDVYARVGDFKMGALWTAAVACCAGFVLLKLYDLELARHHGYFRVVSGHFLSKVCDILQIHFALEFFLRGVKLSKRKMK